MADNDTDASALTTLQPRKHPPNFMREWYNFSKMYDPPTVIPLLQQPIPDAVAIRLKGWQDKAALLPLEHCMEIMREDFRHYSEAEPSAPVEFLVQWANTSCGQPAAAAMLLWMGELFAEAHPKNTPDELKTRTENALCRDHYQHIWPGAYSIGRELWPSLSEKQVIRRLTSRLSDYVACQVWGGRWLRLKNYPQTKRTEPHAHERRSRDIMERWKGDPKEVVLEAQEERIFDDLLRRARPAYPNHPLAHAVKLEQPKEPAQGNAAFLMLFSLIPLAQHQYWCTADILRCLLLLRPGLQSQFDLGDPEKRAAGCKYINRQLLKPIGLGSLDAQGRPANGARPTAFGAARIVVEFLREMLL